MGIRVPSSSTASPPCLVIVARARSRRGARAASSPMISQVHRWMVDAETPLPPAMSASRWSWRSVASTMRAILPGGSLRHREPIFFRWARSRSATKVSVWRDSGSAHW